MEPTEYVLHSLTKSLSEIVPATELSMPAVEAGVPCHYIKRELIPIGQSRKHPDAGYSIDVTEARADKWIQHFNKMLINGQPVPAPTSHEDMTTSKGKWVKLSREDNGQGGSSLFGVLKVVGDRTKEDVLNLDVSIFAKQNVKDDKGNLYDEALEHIAVTPYPALTGLSGWTSIAASRGPARVPVFELAASRSPDMIDFKKLRETLGAGPEVPDENLPEMAANKLASLTTEVTTKGTDVTAALTRATAAETKLTEANTQLALARANPSNKPVVIDDTTAFLTTSAFAAGKKAAIDAGGVLPAVADEIDKLLIVEGKPSTLSLSRVGNEPLGSRIWSLLAQNLRPALNGTGTAQSHGVVALARTADGKEVDHEKVGRDQGSAYQQDQLAQRGLK